MPQPPRKPGDPFLSDTPASPLQHEAALRVAHLYEQMGLGGMMTVDDRYRVNFMGGPYFQPWKSEEPGMRAINNAMNLARRSTKEGPEVDRARAIAARAKLAEAHAKAARRK